jgi:hypothetical protein
MNAFPTKKRDSRRRTSMRRGRYLGVSGVAGIAFVVAILLLGPSASATPLGVSLKKPFSGTAATSETNTTATACNGAGTGALPYPYFSPSRGRGGVGQDTASTGCAAWAYEYFETQSAFGFDSSAFTPASSVNHDHIKFRWSLDYYLYVQTAFAGGNNTAYAWASVLVGAWLLDVTTNTLTGAGNSYYNYTYLYDQTGSIGVTIYPVSTVITVISNLTSADSYVLETSVMCDTIAWTIGPAGSSNTAYAQLDFPGHPAGGVLTSISY